MKNVILVVTVLCCILGTSEASITFYTIDASYGPRNLAWFDSIPPSSIVSAIGPVIGMEQGPRTTLMDFSSNGRLFISPMQPVIHEVDPQTGSIISSLTIGNADAEVEGLAEVTEKASTLFRRNSEGQPILWDYQVKGFLKSACLAMITTGTVTKETLKKVKLTEWTYKRTIDLTVFVAPRRLVLQLPKGVDPNNLDFLERPLRADTMKGARIALARSESCPTGTGTAFEIITLNPKLEGYIKGWLNYGALSGLGQWRSGSFGRFSHKILD